MNNPPPISFSALENAFGRAPDEFREAPPEFKNWVLVELIWSSPPCGFPAQARTKPLSPETLKRIAAGRLKFFHRSSIVITENIPPCQPFAINAQAKSK